MIDNRTATAIAEARLRPGAPDLVGLAELQASASDGDLARAALDVLAEDPAYAEPIRIMSEHAAGQRYIDPTSIGVGLAALLVLQTRVKIKRRTDGKWSFEGEKKALGDGAVRVLIEKILERLGL